jgi:hypothetical protein
MSNTNIISRYFSLLLIGVLLLVASCGYYNPYVVNSDATPISLNRSMWNNQTNELGFETVCYHSLSNWLRKTKLINLKEQSEKSQYQLTGTILSINYPEISYGGYNVATELRAQLTVEYILKDTQKNTIVWQNKKTYSDELKYHSDPSQLQSNKKKALAEIADDISEEIYLYIIQKVMRKK